MVTLPPTYEPIKILVIYVTSFFFPYELHNEVLYARLLRSNLDATICYLSHIINNIITAIEGT